MFKAVSLFLALIINLSIMMSCSKEDPVDKAARLVKESYTLEKEQPVELSIENTLTKIQNRGDSVKRFGWSVDKKTEQIYLVSYKYEIFSFNRPSGKRGWYFEVNPATGAVRNVTSKYEWVVPSFDVKRVGEEDILQEPLIQIPEMPGQPEKGE